MTADLPARLEAGPGSRKLDGEMAVLFGMLPKTAPDWLRNWGGPFEAENGTVYAMHSDGRRGVNWQAPHYTSSVDDGLALLKGMDGWWLQRLGRITDQNIYSAVLTNGFQGQDAAAATPALALCAALVRARAQQQKDSNDEQP